MRVKFFALARDLAGVAERDIEVPNDATVAEALAVLVAATPSLGQIAPRLAVAVNLEYVARDHALHAGDEMALIPPVSGGET